MYIYNLVKLLVFLLFLDIFNLSNVTPMVYLACDIPELDEFSNNLMLDKLYIGRCEHFVR